MRSAGRAAAAFGIRYREAVDADLPFLERVYALTRTEELAVTGWSEAMKAAFLRQQFGAQHAYYRSHYPGAEWLVIQRGGEDLGRLYVVEWADQVRVIDIALLPDARRGGLGGAIMSDLAREADAKGKPLSIHVERMNPARRLYERLGFEAQPSEGVYELMIRPAGAGTLS